MDMSWLLKEVEALGGYGEVARLTGLSRGHVSNAANGKQPLGKATAVKLAKAMPHVPIELWWSAICDDSRPAR